jgi:hypothetical protein
MRGTNPVDQDEGINFLVHKVLIKYFVTKNIGVSRFEVDINWFFDCLFQKKFASMADYKRNYRQR